MEKTEKLLLLQITLEDVRGGWGGNAVERLEYALTLARELELPEHVGHIEDAIRWCQGGTFDGRDLSGRWEHGGYDGGEEVHGLTHTIMDRSEEFQATAAAILSDPGDRFDDWDDYMERVLNAS